MKRFLIFILLMVAVTAWAGDATYPESISGGAVITEGVDIFAHMTEQRNIPWGMPPLSGDLPGYIGHVEVVSDEVISITWDAYFYSPDGTVLFDVNRFTEPDLFAWNDDCGCYYREIGELGDFVAFEAFNFSPPWTDQNPVATGLITSGCLTQTVEGAPPWRVFYEESTACIWTEYSVGVAPQAVSMPKRQIPGNRIEQ